METAETPPAATRAGLLLCRQRAGGHGAPRSHRWGHLMAKANPQQAEGARAPDKHPTWEVADTHAALAAQWCRGRVGDGCPLTSSGCGRANSGRWGGCRHLGMARTSRCLRRGSGVPLRWLRLQNPRWRTTKGLCHSCAGAVSPPGCDAQGACDGVPGRVAGARGARRDLPTAAPLGSPRSPGSGLGAAPGSACPSDPWSHSCWVTGDSEQQGL